MASLNNLHTRGKRKSKKVSSEKHRSSNITIIGLSITILAALVIVQAFRWQVLYADKFTNMSEEQYSSNVLQKAPRGTITASDGTILAVDQPTWNVYATLSNDEEERKLFFENKDKFVAEVSGILNIEKSEIESKLTDDFVYASLAKSVTTEKKKALEKAEIFGKNTSGFGLYFESQEKRIYPNGSLAAHVLGFLGQDENGKTVGQYGIQGYYFRDITGKEGYSYEEKDSSGNVILTAEYQPILPREGKDFKLTIVPNIQSKVEKILEEGVKHSRAKSGTAIIMDPSTGAIIAMANYPTYDPNEYWRTSEPWILKNRAISDVYEYGSVQKPITLGIALETGAIDKDFTCNDKTGFIDLYDKTGYADLKGKKVYTWNRQASGVIDIAGIFAKSNNPCTATVALKVDSQEYYSSLKEFGLGEFIGIGLQEESNSFLKSFENTTKLDIIMYSFGQGIVATPLQVLSALSTYANDGVRMRPYIISQIKDEKETIDITPQIASQPVSKETATIIKEAMGKAVDMGSLGVFAGDLKGYSIGAKTGTAQIAKTNELGYKEDYTNDTVVGLSPVDDPKMIMLVKLEEPQIGKYATLTASPVWRDIFLAIADDLEIKKNN
ncbi:penicillin-binding protein 2 [Candidatus Microgenomates bacterium]|jgi:cell division protein FtsI (penicillin-binding protein 3)/stage V sporulation protein D (sporulation-specific penicillin-binding protein)|nr:penicillin-binding protein 2 [Candidatus Microgenomates bacterium]